MTRGLVRIIIIGVVVIVAIGAFLFRDRLSDNAAKLQVGDCFDVPAVNTVTDVQHHPCNEAHDGEVFLVGTYPGDDSAAYPADSDFQTWVGTNCAQAFGTYTGLDIATADVQVGFFRPTETGWTSSSHDRVVTCYVSPASGKTSQSYKVAAAPSR